MTLEECRFASELIRRRLIEIADAQMSEPENLCLARSATALRVAKGYLSMAESLLTEGEVLSGRLVAGMARIKPPQEEWRIAILDDAQECMRRVGMVHAFNADLGQIVEEALTEMELLGRS